MFSCAGMATRGPARSISVARVASRVIRGKRRVMTQTPSPPRRSPSRSRPRSRSPVIAGGRSDTRSVGHPTRPRPRPRARARLAIPAHENNVRSPRFLLRRPRRRLQGDQGPSTFFFVERLVANGARTARRARHRRERERTRGNAHRSRGIVERSRSGRLDALANAREVIEGDDEIGRAHV